MRLFQEAMAMKTTLLLLVALLVACCRDRSAPPTVPSARDESRDSRNASGQAGSLIFTIPDRFIHFEVDLNADVRQPRRDPGGIYEEWRFKAPVWGTGMFAIGNALNTKLALVLRGTGNICISASEIKNWNLEVSGPRASYSFYGDFVQGPATQKN